MAADAAVNRKTITSVRDLFAEFQQERGKNNRTTARLRFAGVGNQDVYNITAPFVSAGKTIIAGRVEPRDRENSHVVFFEETYGVWSPVAGAPVFELQDPFVSFIHQELIFGGVEITTAEKGFTWKTVFFRGRDIFNLVEFFRGPDGMKDIRLCDLEDGRIAVFTRPQGRIGGRGAIGYTEVRRLTDLTSEVIEDAALVEGMFDPLDWGGVNEAHLLAGGEIGLLAHAACYSHDPAMRERHYYATSFIFNPLSRHFRDYRIIASRDQFEQGPAKRKGLSDVIFSAGLTPVGGATILYVGVSDCEAHWIEIADPFYSGHQR